MPRCPWTSRGARGGATACCTRSIRARTWTRTATASATCAASPHRLDHLQWLGVDGIWLDPDHGLAQRRLGLRRRRLLRRRSRARHARRRRGARRRGREARHPRACSTSSRTTRAISTRGSGMRCSSRDSRAPRLVRVGRSQARRLAAEQLGDGVRPARSRVDVRRRQRPVLPQPVPVRRSPTSTGGTKRSATRSTTSCASGSTAASPASASTCATRSSRTATCATTRPPPRTTTGGCR